MTSLLHLVVVVACCKVRERLFVVFGSQSASCWWRRCRRLRRGVCPLTLGALAGTLSLASCTVWGAAVGAGPKLLGFVARNTRGVLKSYQQIQEPSSVCVL